MLQQLGHPQPPTSVILDNSNTDNFIKNNATQKDLNHGICDTIYWLRDLSIQKKSNFKTNLANYHTKHFPIVYQFKICEKCVTHFHQYSFFLFGFSR